MKMTIDWSFAALVAGCIIILAMLTGAGLYCERLQHIENMEQIKLEQIRASK